MFKVSYLKQSEQKYSKMDNMILSPIPLNEFKDAIRDIINEALLSNNSIIAEPKEPDELLTSIQAAKILQVSKVTLHKWKLEGKIKSYRIGSRIRFKYAEVLEALNGIKTIKSR